MYNQAEELKSCKMKVGGWRLKDEGSGIVEKLILRGLGVLVTDKRTDGQTYVILESLLRLKTETT